MTLAIPAVAPLQPAADAPRPAGRPIVRMNWHDLLFLHWRIDPAEVVRVLPRGLAPDVFEAAAWVGLIPFTMTGFSVLNLGAPGARAFHECNVRTYVTVGGVPGVYFFSLDALSALAVHGARLMYGLAYHRAQIWRVRETNRIDYRVARCNSKQATADIAWEVGQTLPPAPPGSLEWFLTERYCLYVRDRRGRIQEGRIWHPRWRLREARLLRREETLTAAAGLRVQGAPDSVFASDGTCAEAWRLSGS